MRTLFAVVCALAAVGCGPRASDVAVADKPAEKASGKGGIRRGEPKEWVHFAAFSPDGSALLTGYMWEGSNKRPEQPRGLALWDVATGKQLWLRTEEQVGGRCWPFTFFPDGKRILVRTHPVSGGGPDRLRVLNAADGTEARAYDLDAASINCLAVAPDGKTFLIPGDSGPDIDIMDTDTGKVIRSLHGGDGVKSLAFSPDGKQVLSAAQKPGVCCLWDLTEGEPIRQFRVADGWGVRGAAAFSHDGRYAVLQHLDGRSQRTEFIVFKTDNGRLFRSIPAEVSDAVAFTSDGKGLVSINAMVSRLVLYEVESGKEVWSAKMDCVYAVALSADAKWAFSDVSWDGSGTIWDATTGKALRQLGGGTK